MKRVALGLVLSATLAVSGVATAAVFSASGPSPASAAGTHPWEADEPKDTEGAEADDAGIHGGPIERFHGSGDCGLTAVGELPGNWTHGDYVDAVATATGDSTLIVQAAQSDCGKPMVAVNHGPPAHALANRSAHASGPGNLPAAVPEGAGPPGS